MARKTSGGLVALVALVALMLAACTAPGGVGISGLDGLGGLGGSAAPTGQSRDCWVLADSRGMSTQPNSSADGGIIGWAPYVNGCVNYSQGGQGFTVKGMYGSTLSEWFTGLTSEYGLPTKVYVSEGVNDAIQGHDARQAAAAFHQMLDSLGVQQVWATAPYVADPYTSANPALVDLNASLTWAKDCAGPDPDPNTFDGVHITNAGAFAGCITG
jgi:hypothetical protein